MYIADTFNHRIRKVTVSTGILSTIAGSGGTCSFSGDNGLATSATLCYPYGVALDSSGITYRLLFSHIMLTSLLLLDNVYIVDSNRIRKVTISTGIITTIAGTGSSSYSGDNGPATSAAFGPQGVIIDSSGFLHFFITNFILF